jgi:hypothetical protein
MNDMAQMHVYSIADEKPEKKADNEFAYMGLFKNLDQVPSRQRPSPTPSHGP